MTAPVAGDRMTAEVRFLSELRRGAQDTIAAGNSQRAAAAQDRQWLR